MGWLGWAQSWTFALGLSPAIGAWETGIGTGKSGLPASTLALSKALVAIASVQKGLSACGVLKIQKAPSLPHCLEQTCAVDMADLAVSLQVLRCEQAVGHFNSGPWYGSSLTLFQELCFGIQQVIKQLLPSKVEFLASGLYPRVQGRDHTGHIQHALLQRLEVFVLRAFSILPVIIVFRPLLQAIKHW